MADQITAYQSIAQVEYDDPAQLAVSQSIAQVEHTEYDRMTVYQVFAQVEYELPPPGPNLTQAEIPIALLTLDFGFQMIRRATSFYVDTFGNAYLPGLEFPTFSEELPDTFFGSQNSGAFSVRIELGGQGAPGDESFSDIVAANDLRGGLGTLSWYDPVLGERVKYDIDSRAVIDSYELDDTFITINFIIQDDPIFDTLLPREVVTTDLFNDTAIDLGQPINICIGHCRDVPCWNVKNDTTNDEYDYVIGYASIEGLWTGDGLGVKRNGVFVNPAEYTYMEGGSGAEYRRFAVLRFSVEQKDFDGSFMHITACVKGMKFGTASAVRNFISVTADLIEWESALSDNYGVDIATWPDQSLLPEESWMCDICIGGEQKKAKDWFNELLNQIPMTLSRLYNNEFLMRIEAKDLYLYPLWDITVVLGYNDGFYNNCEVTKRWVTPASQTYKNVRVRYDFFSNQQGHGCYYEISAYGDSFGADTIVELKNTVEFTTASKVLSRIINTQKYSKDWVAITAGPEARTVKKGTKIRLYSDYDAGTYQDYIVQTATRNYSGDFSFECRVYSDDIYGDLTITEPTAPVDSTSSTNGPGHFVGSYTHADATEQPVELSVQEITGYDIYGMVNGVVPSASYEIMSFSAARPFTLPAGLTGSKIWAKTAAAAEQVFTIKKNAGAIGTATFAAAGTVATFSFATAVTFASTDVLSITGAATQDITLADIRITLIGTKDLT